MKSKNLFFANLSERAKRKHQEDLPVHGTFSSIAVEKLNNECVSVIRYVDEKGRSLFEKEENKMPFNLIILFKRGHSFQRNKPSLIQTKLAFQKVTIVPKRNA